MNKIFFILFLIINNFLFAQNSKNTVIDNCSSDTSFFNEQNKITGINLKLFVDKTEIKYTDSEVCFAVNITNLTDSLLYIRKFLNIGTVGDEDFKINILNCETKEYFSLLNHGKQCSLLETIKLENYTLYYCIDFKNLASIKDADSCFKADKSLNGIWKMKEKKNNHFGKYYIQVVYFSDCLVTGKMRKKKYFKGPLYSNIIKINYMEM
jgi:predicted transport protein